MRVFWLEPTAAYDLELRRYSSSDGSSCAAKPYGMSCHDARVPLGVITADEPPTSYSPAEADAESWKSDRITRDDSRFPTHCRCGFSFAADDAWQVNYSRLFEARGGPNDGERFTLRGAPVGAMWDATWYPRHRPWIGLDGIALMVRCPDNWDWHVDGPASNCDRKDDKEHFCWCRQGDPRTGNVHVDKNGNTCGAGAGSIQTPTWHGFLHNGDLHA